MEKTNEELAKLLGLTVEQVEYLKESWLTTKVAEMAAKLNVTDQALRRLARKLNLGPRPERGSRFDPSRKEIRQRAAEVRSRWTPEERSRREVGVRGKAAWTPPMVRVGDIEAPSYARI